MQHPVTDIGSPGPCWGKEEQTASAHVPLTTEAVVSHNSRILAFAGNPASYVQAYGNGNGHRSLLARSLDMDLALMSAAPSPSLKSSWNRSLVLISQTRRRLILLPLATSPRISNAPCILYLSLSIAIAVLTIKSMSCRRNPTILPQMDNFRPSSNFRTLAISVAT